jgi:GNAT superfamily N-acetyltransferase
MNAIRVVPYRAEYAGDFRQLNLDWIERLFKVEAADRKVLDDPERAIIATGGMIFFALDGAAVVGTVAMIRIGDGCCELAKMAVAASHQRRGIGELLGDACKSWAKGNAIETIVLETNSKLGGAIRLYERLGFHRVVDPRATEYARCDVHMELSTKSAED